MSVGKRISFGGMILVLGLVFHCSDKGTEARDSIPPAAVADLAVSDATASSVTIIWTAPGDDRDDGTAGVYDIRYATASITESNWDSATQVSGEPSPQSAGAAESLTITDLDGNTTYYFALKTADEMPNWSGLSNVASGATLRIPPATWEKTFGGPRPDGSKTIHPTADGGYIAAGMTRNTPSGNENVYLLRLDAYGDLVWEKTFGGENIDDTWAGVPTPDGGHAIVGWTRSFGAGMDDVHLLKTDASGGLSWRQTFGGTFSEKGLAVALTGDGGYIITGWTRSFGAGLYDVYLIKTDASGVAAWQKTFGGPGYDVGHSVAPAPDGGYIITGHTSEAIGAENDLWLIKTDAAGDSLWTKKFGGAEEERGYRALPHSAGGYIIVGATKSFGAGGVDVYLIRTNSLGEIAWENTIGGAGDDYGICIAPTTDGGYIIAGLTDSFGAGEEDVYLVKTDAAGNMIWQKTFGGTGNDQGAWVALTPDGGYIIAGWTNSFGAGSSDAYIIKVNEDGEF